ncbi:6,7-dimethyl-8-ribityllumazine synthase [Alphaproteobacteria bacterium]|nr:6,7-dimethyl-8-ribityllumazine synthase [Alphaproteobacteria bacterium]MDC1023299.1 6,7-dimethyl-8-ribityllumazine synthase [Alphaproteobacteria bacterium]
MSSSLNILLVCSPYYKEITNNLIIGATEVLLSKSINFKTLYVPGALEIAPAIKFNYDKSKDNRYFDGFIALGCIIRGETYHFEVVSNESARSLSDLSIRYSLPIGNGILTVEDKNQALTRSNPKKLNKGAGAALACLSLIDIKSNDIYDKS